MNFIDAIEGTGCSVLQRIHQGYLDGTRDDSEFIRNVKLVIDGVQQFIADHPELMIPADVVRQVLYENAKQLWLCSPGDTVMPHDAGNPENPADAEPDAYRNYYFDYIYQHGAYPR